MVKTDPLGQIIAWGGSLSLRSPYLAIGVSATSLHNRSDHELTVRYNTDELHYIDEQWTHSIVNRHSYSNESALYMLDGGYTLAIGKYWALEGLLSMGAGVRHYEANGVYYNGKEHDLKRNVWSFVFAPGVGVRFGHFYLKGQYYFMSYRIKDEVSTPLRGNGVLIKLCVDIFGLPWTFQ